MDALRDLLGRHGAEDRAAMFAAAIISQANEALRELFEVDTTLAQAVSYRDGIITIETGHGAVTAKILDRKDETIERIQQRVQRIFPEHELHIRTLVVRGR